jgi:ABC-type polysaccharide/polyol phosphate transport system ATPase subunit/ABC-type polysaccharide/polyol phosphate export permease
MGTPSPTATERSGSQATAPVMISARAVSKKFRLPHEKYTTVRERVLHPLDRLPDEALRALHGVSFDIRQGEFFGIVGRNGSGKSTLLKCISGIYGPDEGEIAVQGRVAPFIELGVGFNPEMTARDNVILNAVMLGMTPRQARERFDEIVAFAELEEFVDLKLKNYSSGMTVRLAFSVTVQVDADVLLFDEVLAVGDAAFQQKCLERFQQLKDAGRTILLVTHSMDSIERFCDRALLLHHGELVDIGDPALIARRYAQINAAAQADATEPPEPPVAPAPPPRPAPVTPPPGAPAIRGNLRRFVTLTRTLAIAEFKLRYLDSKLSYLWAVMRPLALFGVLYAVFTQVARLDAGVEHYALYLLTSIVLWTYFAEATATSVSCVVKRESLIRTLPIPRVAIPLSVALTSLFDLCVNLIAVFVFLLVTGITPSPGWLELPLLVLVLSLLVTGMGMLLSALYVRYRDVDQVWTVTRQTLFYASPIFYVVASLPENLQGPALANPLAALFTEARHALIDPSAPTAAAAIGGAAWLLVPFGVVIGVLAAGLWVFHRESPRLAENL